MGCLHLGIGRLASLRDGWVACLHLGGGCVDLSSLRSGCVVGCSGWERGRKRDVLL